MAINNKFRVKNGLTVGGDIDLTGTIDGRDLAVDGAKLDNIESGATADQTVAEILNAITPSGVLSKLLLAHGYRSGIISEYSRESLSTAKFDTPIDLYLTGGVTGVVSFDGSNSVTMATNVESLKTSRLIQLTGDVTGQASFDGSSNIQINTTSSSGGSGSGDATSIQGVYVNPPTSDNTYLKYSQVSNMLEWVTIDTSGTSGGGGTSYYSVSTTSPLTLPTGFDGSGSNFAPYRAILWGHDSNNMYGYGPMSWWPGSGNPSTYAWSDPYTPSGGELENMSMGEGTYIMLAPAWPSDWMGDVSYYPSNQYSSYVGMMEVPVGNSYSASFELYAITFTEYPNTVIGGEATVDEEIASLYSGSMYTAFVWRLDKTGAESVNMGANALSFSNPCNHQTIYFYKYQM